MCAPLDPYINAFYETGFIDPIDGVILAYRKFDLSKCGKLDAVPYPFFSSFGAGASFLCSNADVSLGKAKTVLARG